MHKNSQVHFSGADKIFMNGHDDSTLNSEIGDQLKEVSAFAQRTDSMLDRAVRFLPCEDVVGQLIRYLKLHLDKAIHFMGGLYASLARLKQIEKNNLIFYAVELNSLKLRINDLAEICAIHKNCSVNQSVMTEGEVEFFDD